MIRIMILLVTDSNLLSYNIIHRKNRSLVIHPDLLVAKHAFLESEKYLSSSGRNCFELGRIIKKGIEVLSAV